MEQIIDDGGELLLGLFVEIGDGNSCSKDCIVRVGNGHVSSCFGSLKLYQPMFKVGCGKFLAVHTKLSNSMVVTPL